MYDIGKEIVIYRDAEDCACIVCELLAGLELAQKIRWVRRERCLRDHIYEARWSQVFNLADITKIPFKFYLWLKHRNKGFG